MIETNVKLHCNRSSIYKRLNITLQLLFYLKIVRISSSTYIISFTLINASRKVRDELGGLRKPKRYQQKCETIVNTL